MGEHDDGRRHGTTPAPEQEQAETTADLDPSSATAMQDEIERLRQEASDSYDRFLRERAEADNFKKRTLREKAEAVRFAAEPMVHDLLPIVDNLERALAHSNNADPALRSGVELILKSLLDVLERHNVKRVESEGERFDPSLHQAIAQIESPEHAHNAVVQQHQVGYRLHDRLIRPALVTVNTQKTTGDTVESDQNSD